MLHGSIQDRRLDQLSGEQQLRLAPILQLRVRRKAEEIEESPPLLDHWAIAMIDKGPNSDAPYLMFSNDPDLLVSTATRIRSGNKVGLGNEPEIKAIVTSLRELGCNAAALDRVVRTKLSLRAKYNLLRAGKLKDSDSVLSSFYRRFLEDQEADQFLNSDFNFI